MMAELDSTDDDMFQLTDTHAHLDSRQFKDDLPGVLARARERGVGDIITIGVDLRSSERSVSLATQLSGTYATVGVHPHDARYLTAAVISRLEELSRTPRVVAIGEIGLDYYRDLSPRVQQRDAFRAQLQLAGRVGLPVVVHDREAHDDVMSILQDQLNPEHTVIMHCFSGDLELAEECVRRGYYISFAGPITYNRSDRLREVAAHIPPRLLLVETDCPYLAPHPFRGRRNEPAFVAEVASTLAGVTGHTLDGIARLTTANARTAFVLDGHADG